MSPNAILINSTGIEKRDITMDSNLESVILEPDSAFDNRLGQILLKEGKIKEKDVKRIITYAQKKKIRFGEAAIKLRAASRNDVERAIAAHFDYPYLLKNEGNLSKELVSAYRPFTTKAEDIRNLRSQLISKWFNDEHNCLAIVSPNSGSGRSYLAANLAIAFSQLGHKTLLVDADLQDARQHKIFGLDNSIGLSTLLVGNDDLDLPIRSIELINRLYVMTAGAAPPNPSELLSREKFKQLKSVVSSRFDVVIFDTSPGELGNAAEAVAEACGGALMVLVPNRTHHTDASTFVDRVNDRATVVGAVFNKP